MKSVHIHLKNKYPGGSVIAKEESIDVYNADGEHVVALRKNGAQQMIDVSEEHGLRDKFDLAPIPKDSRVHKLVNGKIGFDNEHKERKEKLKDFLCPEKKDVVLSCAELEEKHGFKFDKEQKLISKK